MIKYKYDSEVIFDISNLDKRELSLLYDAIDDNKQYIDIEMFLIFLMCLILRLWYELLLASRICWLVLFA